MNEEGTAAARGDDRDEVAASSREPEGVPIPVRYVPAVRHQARASAAAELALGGLLIAADSASRWLRSRSDKVRAAAIDVAGADAGGDAAAGDDDTTVAPGRARQAVVGLTWAAQETLAQAGAAAMDAGGAAAELALRPMRRWRVFAPARRGLVRARGVGSRQVDRWAEEGRRRESRSRALTQAALDQAVADSVGVLAREPHVQVIVQEIVSNQSAGVAAEIVEELRERAVTLDLRIEEVSRRRLGRPASGPALGPGAPEQPPVRAMPDADGRSGAGHLGGYAAGLASRALAIGVDVFVLVAVFAVLGGFATAARDLFHLDDLYRAVFGISISPDAVRTVAAAVSLLVVSAYFVFSWFFLGQTLGKMVLGLRVVGRDGRPPSLGRSALRLAGYVLVALTFGLGYLWLVLDRRRQGLDDKVAGTFVVYAWQARPDEVFLVPAGEP